MHTDSQESDHYYWVKRGTSCTYDPFGGRRWPAETDLLVRQLLPPRQYRRKLWFEVIIVKPEEYADDKRSISMEPSQTGWDRMPTLEELKQRVAHQIID
jgi:hypothetical protein